jgi:hypothetical protein
MYEILTREVIAVGREQANPREEKKMGVNGSGEVVKR